MMVVVKRRGGPSCGGLSRRRSEKCGDGKNMLGTAFISQTTNYTNDQSHNR